MSYSLLRQGLFYIACVLSSALLMADDTEIYTNVNLSSQDLGQYGNPNVLLLLDTSGSMSWDAPPSRQAYDPNTTYPGLNSRNRNRYYIYTTDLVYRGEIRPAAMHCNAAVNAISQNPGAPRFLSSYVFQDSRGWRAVYTQRSRVYNRRRGVECLADQGVHGHNSQDTSLKTYARKNSKQWSSDPQDQVTFSATNMYVVSANYHFYLRDSDQIITQSREAVMKATVTNMLDTFNNINIGIMTFPGGGYSTFANTFRGDEIEGESAGRAGLIKHTITPLNDSTREELKDTVNAIDSTGYTPLTNTLYEAGLYFSGQNALFAEGTLGDDADEDAYTNSSKERYKSPMNSACQKNAVILLSDGSPYRDGYINTNIRALTGSRCFYVQESMDPGRSCLDELAEYLYSQDLRGGVEGKQNLITHTIGFAIPPGDGLLLEATAKKGGGLYKTAQNADELNDAFATLLSTISTNSASFVAPTVPVSNYNSLQNDNDLYFALFKPESTTRWNGNIKRYGINSDGVIVDENNDPAINDQGSIKEGSKSWWGSTIDGEKVHLGGVAEQITLTNRKLYTYLGNTPSNINLTANIQHQLAASNSAITQAMLGSQSSTERSRWLNWISGQAVDTSSTSSSVAHQYLGDPLHSRPIVVTYGKNSDNTPDSTIFYGTNLGFIYANDTDDGKERFAFMPKELLGNIATFYKNENINVSSGKPYGMDGEITVWVKENPNDDDQTIEPDEGDKVMVYATMRRGGQSIYALDVTNRDYPKLAWQIKPEGRFADLGQSWSRPQLSRVKWNCSNSNCEEKTVLFFGGGYDNSIFDDAGDTYHAGNSAAPQKGNAIYMVDAETGQYLWSAGGSGENHSLSISQFLGSVPSNVGVIDINRDGFADTLYVIDILGHYFRFDLADEPASASNFAKGKLIADFSDTSNATRFFNGPDISLQSPRGAESYFTIATTTGNRSRPKTQRSTADKVIVLFDTPVFTDKPSNATHVTLSNLQSVSLGTTANTIASDKKGWYMNLNSSLKEKGLSPTLTYSNHLLFGTYLPDTGNNRDACSGALGSSRFYQMSVTKGHSTLVDSQNRPQNYKELAQQGIPPAPVILNIGDKTTVNGQTKTTIKPILCLGSECQQVDQDGSLKRLYWRQVKP